MTHGDELAETAAETATAGGNRPLGPGDGIGRYRVLRVLGQGGMGVVYAAHDPDLDRPVALKLLRGAAGDEARTRLLREARAMAKLSHPNVITVYEVGSAGPIDFVAMELIDGQSLAEWLKAAHRPPEDVLRVFRAAARGLQAAHVAGLVHRDFKPANVLVGKHERVVVTDFGLARAFDDVTMGEPTAVALAATQPIAVPAEARGDAASLSSTLTRTGALLGTPAYMAPEQFAGVTAGPRSDQYAFCVALWEALTGARPFKGATLDELRRAATAGEATGVDALPRWLRPILQRGMARDAVDRYPDLGALMAAIDRAERRPRTRALVATAGAALVAAIATVTLWPGARSTSRAPAGSCPDPALALAGVWSPTASAGLAAHLAAAPGTARELLDGLDRVAAAWRDAERAACAAPPEPAQAGRLSCLARIRDQLTAAVGFANQTPAADLRAAAVLDELDDPAGCAEPAASARPGLPADPPTLAALSAIRVDLARALMTDGGEPARTMLDGAIERARALPYPAALAEALLAAGVAARRADDFDRAEAMFDEAATTAEAIAADGLRAAALVGTARSTSDRSSDASRVRAALAKARAAVTRAGDPAELIAHLDVGVAQVELGGGELDRAIAAAERARLAFDRVGNARSAIIAFAVEATARNQRDRGDDIARAIELLADAASRAVRVLGEHDDLTTGLRKTLGLILSDHDPARAAAVFASLPTHDQPPPAATPVRARVVGPDGRPRTGAIVHVGKELVALADGTILTTSFDRVPTGPRRVATDDAGRFTIDALPDEIVEVVAGDLRSRPLRVRDLPAVILVAPTQRAVLRSTIGGGDAGSITVVFTVADGDANLAYQAITHRIDAQTWEVAALPDAPRLQAILVRTGRTSNEFMTRQFAPDRDRLTELVIDPPPAGVALDLVVRGDRMIGIPGATVYVLLGRELAGRTLRIADFGARAFATSRLFSGYARPGAPSWSAAAPASEPDDLRVLFPSVPSGPLTVCVVPFGGDIRDPRQLAAMGDFEQLEMHCKAIDVPAGVAVHRATVETPAMQRPR